MDYVKFDTDALTKNKTLTNPTWNWGANDEAWTLMDVKTKILNMHLCVERISVEQKSDPLRDKRFLTFKYSYSRFILSPLTPHTSQELELRWDVDRLPLTLQLFFYPRETFVDEYWLFLIIDIQKSKTYSFLSNY